MRNDVSNTVPLENQVFFVRLSAFENKKNYHKYSDDKEEEA